MSDLNQSSSNSAPSNSGWVQICRLDELPTDSGMAALLNENTPQEEQIALFKVVERATQASTIYAISNFDPFSQANVLARGILCSSSSSDKTSEEKTSPDNKSLALAVASPVLKQHFDLSSGQCVEESDVVIKTYPSKISDGLVFVQASANVAAAGESS